MPDGIDISAKLNRIFWTDMGTPSEDDGSIHSCKLDGSDVQVVVPPGVVHTPKQCVIDETSQKLYFCDREGLRVMRVNLDGSNIETLIQTGDWQKDLDKARDQRNWCVGITVAPKLGKLFWTQKGSSKASEGRIFSAHIDFPDGTDAKTRKDIELVIGNLPEPIDLDLNSDESALFWSDRGELPLGNTLNKKTIKGDVPEGEKRLGRQILAQGLGEDLAGRIWKCDADTPSIKEKLRRDRAAAARIIVRVADRDCIAFVAADVHDHHYDRDVLTDSDMIHM
nr:3-hydroxyacyl-coa dehydrogenase-like protein lam1 [Quercus suber]